MRKLTFFLTVLAVFTLTAVPVLALDWGSGYLSATGLGTKELRESVMSIVNVALGFLGILAILIILWGGFVWLTAGGDESKVESAKKIITGGVVGLVIILSALAITNFVVAQILNATGA
ncbi:hypothetical protein KKA15_03065 [Patescibacteria group bacterium]|nr:hypothetical protein [Patescibacteria group bacterium]